ncbi:unnamed protein product [Heligmosomoides polygyrus]|uniref:Uncharacterized protein n=1 Tax=Heligmosomoides polygyrus TaxID=6339 RepID=A0A183F8M1_HELPZ|nr:unnamed protein product [Heligmosomoides polygyrus]
MRIWIFLFFLAILCSPVVEASLGGWIKKTGKKLGRGIRTVKDRVKVSIMQRHPSRLVPDENRRDELRFLQQYRADSKTAVMLKLLNEDKVVLHSFS